MSVKSKKNKAIKRIYQKPTISTTKMDNEITMVMMSIEPDGDPFSFSLNKNPMKFLV